MRVYVVGCSPRSYLQRVRMRAVFAVGIHSGEKLEHPALANTSIADDA